MKFATIAALVAAAAAQAPTCVDDNVKAKTALQDAAIVKETKAKAEVQACADKEKAKAGDCPVDGLAGKKASEALKAATSELETAKKALLVAKASCKSTDAAPEPVSAEKDLAKNANTQAAQDVTTWYTLNDSDAKSSAGYDKLDATAKAKFDTNAKELAEARALRDTKEKTQIGFDKLKIEEKTVYLAGLLSWRKEIYKLCKANKDDPNCVNADKLRQKAEEKKIKDGYYSKSKELRAKDDLAYVAQKKKDLAEIVAAAKPKVTGPVIGTSCKKGADGKRPACAADHCCGTAKKSFTSFSGEDVCNSKTATKYEKELVGGAKEQWTFKCIGGAKMLAAGAAAVFAATFMMA